MGRHVFGVRPIILLAAAPVGRRFVYWWRSAAVPSKPIGRYLWVGKDCEYKTLDEALAIAHEHDEIIVYSPTTIVGNAASRPKFTINGN
jgi:hypothetical protein